MTTKQEEILTRNEVISLVPKNGHQQGAIRLIPMPDAAPGSYKGIPFNWEELRKQGKEVETPDSFYIINTGAFAEIDLSHQKMANMWEWMQYCPYIAKSKEELKYKPEALLYPDEPEKELQIKDKVRDIRFELESWIRSSSEVDRVKIGRFLGRNLQNTKPLEVKDYLLDKVKGDKYLDLQKIKREFESGDFKLKLFLFTLEDLRIITRYKTSGYKNGNDILGETIEEAVRWLKEPTNKEEVIILRSKINSSSNNIDDFKKEDEERLEQLKSTLDIEQDVRVLNGETVAK